MMKLGWPLVFFVTGCAKTSPAPVTDATIASGSASVVALVATTPLMKDTPAFFPPNTFPRGADQFVSDWYGKHLVAMNEPSLWAAALRGETAYRFLWLRTWGRPIAVRVTFDGANARLFATRLSGDGGYDPGKVDVHRERDLETTAIHRVEAAFSAASFDRIDVEGKMGADGAQWVLERAKDGVYRLVERWSPHDNAEYAEFVRACDLFLDLAGRDLVTGDVY
jgi:hypothetical protein